MVQPWDFRRGAAGTALLVRFGADRGVPPEVLPAGSGPTPADLGGTGPGSGDAVPEVEARQEPRVARNLARVLPDSGVDADRTGSSFDAGVLARAMPLASPEARQVVLARCRDLAGRRRDRQGTAHAVRARLERSPGSLTEVAADLAMSPRTLRRRLAASGTSFQELLDEARAARAEELLTTGFSVERIAAELRYAEAAGFIRAFRRWRGATPGDYGRRRRAV